MNRTVRDTTSLLNRENRRKSVRYPLTGAVQFLWHAQDGQWYDAIGITRDIGKGGAFIESNSLPPVASVLKLIVTLPAESKSDTTLRLGGVGYVRRIRQESCQTMGFGASVVFRVEASMAKGYN